MTLLIIADRPPSQSILTTLEQYDIDLICTLGDLDYFALRLLEQVQDIPKIGVYGNSCSGDYFESFDIKNMHLETWEFQGLTFGGFEGSVRYKDNPRAVMYTQDEAQEMLRDFPRVDVMLCHAPPFGVNDDVDSSSHQGFHALREYCEIKKPKYLLHGHTYPTMSTLVTQYAETEIVYVYGDRVVDLSSSSHF